MSTIAIGSGGSATTTRLQRHVTSLPRWGQWRCDATLEGGALAPAVGASATLTIGGLPDGTGALVLVGTVEYSGLDAPDLPHVVVVGGAGWDRPIAAPLAFGSDAGVRLSTVLAALSRASGQSIVQPADRVIGQHYECAPSRAGEPTRYRDALAELVRAGNVAGWWVRPDGVTLFTERPAGEALTRATVLRADAPIGMVEVGIDQPADFLPGRTFEGVPIERLVVVESAASLRAELYRATAGRPPTLRQMVARMLADLAPWMSYAYPRTYVVAAVDAAGRLDLVPPVDAPSSPELRAVEAWQVSGALVRTPTVGDEVVVAFRDADRRRPIVTGWAPGVPPIARYDADTRLELGPSAAAVQIAGASGDPVAREGDSVIAGHMLWDPTLVTLYLSPGATAGVYTPVTVVPVPGVAPPPGTPGTALSGAITTGSARVTAE